MNTSITPIYSLAEAVSARRWTEWGWTAPNPEVLDIPVPQHVVRDFGYPGNNKTPYLDYHQRWARRASNGELQHGDLLFCSASIMQVDLKTFPGLLYLKPYDKSEVAEWLELQGVKKPRYGQPVRLSDKVQIGFKLRFCSEELVQL